MAGTRSSSRAVADRYVGAIFEFAEGNSKELAAFEGMFAALEQALAQSAEFTRALANPTLSSAAKVGMIDALAAKLGAGDAQKRFLALLARNGRLDLLAEIIAAFRTRLSAQRGEVVLEIASAHEIAPASLASITSALEKETGKTTVIKTTVKPELLGGITLKLGSTLLDYSVQGKLARLEQSLKERIVNA